jgi:cytosine/adenosine deaminase-related metal-dependent hydrolase
MTTTSTPRRTLITGRWVVGSDGPSHYLLEHGEVVFEGNSILFVGKGYNGAVDERIDAGNAVISPGFIDLDALFDLDSTVLGFDNQPGWKKGRVWAADYYDAGARDVYSPDEEAFSHEYAMCQLLLNGITTALPIRSILYREWAETFEENARAAEIAARLGIRIYLGPSYRTGVPVVEPDGSIVVRWNAERGMRGLDDAVRFVREFDGFADGLIRGFLQPDRIEGCTDELLLATKDAGAELGCPVRLHCCQGEVEVQLVQERWGKSSLTVLRDLGFLEIGPLLPHGTYLGGAEPTPAKIDEEIGWLAESGSSLVHCPLVSSRHGDVLKSFGTVRERGVKLGMGTDTFPPDMFLNMQVGVITARLVEGTLRTSAADYFTATTIGGADALGRDDLGRLMPGAKADMIVVDLDDPGLGQFFDPIQSLVLSGSGRNVRTVIVNGRIVVKDREIPGIDMAAMHERSQKQFQMLIESYPERTWNHPPVEEIVVPAFPIRGA